MSKWDPRQSVVRKRDDRRMLCLTRCTGLQSISKSWFHVDGWVQTCQVEKNCNTWLRLVISIGDEAMQRPLKYN